MGGQPEILGNVMVWLDEAGQIALGWLTSPAAWSQFALLVVAFLAARVIAAKATRALTRVVTPAEAKTGMIASLRRFSLRFLPLLLPLIAYGLTALGEAFTRSMFGSGDVIAFGKRLFIFIAARMAG